MANYTEDLKGPMLWKRERAEVVKDCIEGDTTIDENGIMRWKRNNRVPPLECLEFAAFGLKMPVNVPASVAQGDRETQAAIQAYRNRQAGRSPSPEEHFEMEAAFGKGAALVDIISGRRIHL